MAEKNGSGKMVTIFVAIASTLIGVGVTWGVKTSAISSQAECIKELETRQDTDHDALVELRTDVRYIRQAVDRLMK